MRGHKRGGGVRPAGARDAARARTLHRVKLAIPQPRHGTESLRQGVTTSVVGPFLAGDWTDIGVPCSMESAAHSGALAAEAVLGQALAIPPPETNGIMGLLRSCLGSNRRGVAVVPGNS